MHATTSRALRIDLSKHTELALFSRSDCFKKIALCIRRGEPRFHFNDDDGVTVAAHQVNLTDGAGPVTLTDDEPAALQVTRSDGLTPMPD